MTNFSMNNLIEQVRRTGGEFHLWSPGDCIVVAVSGGPDSVALLHILHQLSQSAELNLKLVCAHVNHSFRGAESDQEAEFVANMSREMGISFELGHIDVPAYMRETGKGTQLAAREKRYEFLYQIAHKYGAQSIALGHHADDQAETVMMRLLRGSGPTGLAGMKHRRVEKNVELIRPLLRIYKNDLVQACELSEISYMTDSSNFINKYDRNAVRLDVLPFLGQYNKKITTSLNRLAEVIGDEDDYMGQQAVKLYTELVSPLNGGLSFSISEFVPLHAALQRRLIKLILDYLPFNTEESDFVKIEAIRKGTIQDQPTTWSLDLGSGLSCCREYDIVSFIPGSRVVDVPEYSFFIDHFPSEVLLPWNGEKVCFTRQQSTRGMEQRLSIGKEEAVFDADEITLPLTVRSRQPGDTMKVMGLNGSKKVKDIFIDEKIPPSLRPKVPIVSDANGNILWIPGIRRSAVALVTEHTTSLVRMTLDKDGV